MTIEDKREIKSEIKGKILVLGLILIILVGFVIPTVKVSARALTTIEQQQINAEQKILDSTNAEYIMIGNQSGGTAAQQKERTKRYNELRKLREIATNKINYIKTMASKDLAPEKIEFLLNNDPVGYCTGGTTRETLYITEKVCKNFWGGSWLPISTSVPTTTKPPAKVATPSTNYTLLAPLPCPPNSPRCTTGQEVTNFNTSEGLSNYLNLMIKIFIGICAVLSIVMIVVGGIEYMTSELVHTKEAGREKITHAILGLLIALGAYALLFTINPDLLKSDADKALEDVKIATPTVVPKVTPPVIPADMKIDTETGRSIYSIHTASFADRNQGNMKCSVPPEGYSGGRIVSGVGRFCGADIISPEDDNLKIFSFCCKYDKLQK